MTYKVASLCSGYGGLELGLQLAGIKAELLWVAETNKAASKVLDARFNVPNLGDITQIDNPIGVDIVTAGFPCQPVSWAGKHEGTKDERWLINDVVELATRADAQWIFLENVRGLLAPSKSEAFGQVVDALSSNGYDARWSCVRADQSVGACHRRDRWFCVAYSSGKRHGSRQDIGLVGELGSKSEAQEWEPGSAWQKLVDRIKETENTTDSLCERLERQGEEHELQERSREINFTWGDYGSAIERWEQVMGRKAPYPTDGDKVDPCFVEWMMGLPKGWVTDVDLSYREKMQLLGNGVVPLQAGFAYRKLLI